MSETTIHRTSRQRHTLEFGATEILQDLLPVRRVIIPSEIGLQLAAEDLESCTLANTVRSHKTQDLAGTRHGQPVELETVGRVAMCHLALEVRGQVDDMDGAKWTFLRADTASDTEALGDEGDLRVGGDLNAELPRADHGARLLALLPTFLQKSVPLLSAPLRTQLVPLVYTVIMEDSG